MCVDDVASAHVSAGRAIVPRRAKKERRTDGFLGGAVDVRDGREEVALSGSRVSEQQQRCGYQSKVRYHLDAMGTDKTMRRTPVQATCKRLVVFEASEFELRDASALTSARI